MGLAEPRGGEIPQTSYEIGLRYSRPPPFKVEVVGKDGPLPPILQRVARSAPAAPGTTSGTAHAGRPQAGWQVQTRYPKAPPHWTSHRIAPLAQRLKECPSLRVLSAPLSEARDRYRGLQAPHPPVPQHYDTLRSLYEQLDSARWLVEPPVSTAHASFRRFQRSELSAPSRLDVPPAYSPHPARVRVAPSPPRRGAPHLEPSPSMRPLADLLLADSSGSEYRSSFSQAHPRVDTTVLTPASSNQEGSGTQGAGPPHPSDVRLAVFAVPQMYATESDGYGSGRPRVV
ncbi:stabilizer of axonemal microtubules 3 [Gadus morhua]|uniref:Uncharacterized protein n=1 Tax=Gadus morhua TaxID=8049 RepID=A0A8C5CRS5_GADMO|nr:uncharacterized protein LOC115534377 [Gadus morhua]